MRLAVACAWVCTRAAAQGTHCFSAVSGHCFFCPGEGGSRILAYQVLVLTSKREGRASEVSPRLPADLRARRGPAPTLFLAHRGTHLFRADSDHCARLALAGAGMCGVRYAWLFDVH